MKFIAILLTVHNRKANTLQCLSNLYAQQPVAGYVWEVYLTNDGCTDGTPETVKEKFPEANIIEGDGNLYWNRGMHKAWQTAASTKEYDYYLWLNDDTSLNPDVLQRLLSSSEEFENKAIIVGTTTAVKSTTLTYGGRTKNGQMIIPIEQSKPCAYFNGNIVLIPLYVYRSIGMNDPVFRHALGDFDYGLRAAKKKIKMYVAPGILGKCDDHERLATWCNSEQPFSKRWKAFRTPLGQNPEEFFIYEKRHGGLSKAVLHYITNHLRVFFPELWTYKIKRK